MAPHDQILSAYLSRALDLIALGNGIAAAQAAELQALLGQVSAAVAAGNLATAAGTRRTVTEVTALVLARYAEIGQRMASQMGQLTAIEAEFAARVAALGSMPTDRQIARAAAAMLLMGAPPAEAYTQQGQVIAQRIGGAIRERAADLIDDAGMRASLTETAESATRQVETLAQTGVNTAAEAGRAAAYDANDIEWVRWASILDSRTSAGCALRHNRLYRLPDYRPVGHNIPIERPPPRHPNCRSTLIPGSPSDNITETPREAFDRWLSELQPDEIARTIGVGRLELYRAGKITLRDLIGQGGKTMTLEELREKTQRRGT